MAVNGNVLKDEGGLPVPQYSIGGGNFEQMQGVGGAIQVRIEDGKDVATGSTGDTSADSTVIGLLKALIEGLTGGTTIQTVIDEFENETHKGNAFYANHGFVLTGTVDAVYTFMFRTGSAAKIVHQRERILKLFDATTVDATVKLYEGGTVSADGTVIPIFNLDRGSATLTTGAIYHTPTVTTLGLDITRGNSVFADGTTNQLAKSTVVGSIEYLMKADTIYILQITNNVANEARGVIGWNWYEKLSS